MYYFSSYHNVTLMLYFSLSVFTESEIMIKCFILFIFHLKYVCLICIVLLSFIRVWLGSTCEKRGKHHFGL